jgi:hypothetical protein
MKITPQVLSIPPYISTIWDNIVTLKSEGPIENLTLLIHLKTGEVISVPSLKKEEIELIFEKHVEYGELLLPKENSKFPLPFSFSLPMKGDGSLASFGDSMNHNPEQSDLPEIPPDILNKVTVIAKAFGFDELTSPEDAKEDCNCIFCQLKRALNPVEHLEEKISAEDLHFRDWEIEEMSEKLFCVTSPLDKNEQYNVYLGEPIGCTCGEKNCEHMKAVLQS